MQEKPSKLKPVPPRTYYLDPRSSHLYPYALYQSDTRTKNLVRGRLNEFKVRHKNVADAEYYCDMTVDREHPVPAREEYVQQLRAQLEQNPQHFILHEPPTERTQAHGVGPAAPPPLQIQLQSMNASITAPANQSLFIGFQQYYQTQQQPPPQKPIIRLPRATEQTQNEQIPAVVMPNNQQITIPQMTPQTTSQCAVASAPTNFFDINNFNNFFDDDQPFENFEFDNFD